MVIWVFLLIATFILELCLLAIPSRKSADKVRWSRLTVPAIILGAIVVYGIVDRMNAMMVALHLCVYLLFAMVADAVAVAVTHNKENSRGTARIWIAAAVACAVWLGIGWFSVHHVWRTDYRLTTGKSLAGLHQTDAGDSADSAAGTLRIAQVTDTHIGVTMDGDDLAEQLARVLEAKPDLVVVTGDFTDEDTPREDMVSACKALGAIVDKVPYGVFFVYGNHDCDCNGHFTTEELDAELRANGVVVLRDETVTIADRIVVIGRRDASESRMRMAELMKGVDTSKFILVLDHQPCDFAAEEAAGVDLVLTGHTHGGQVIPLGLASKLLPSLFGDADYMYGLSIRNGTGCIVSSGMSSWKIKFKTGTVSEFVIIDVKEK
ncbi:MAG: metallophosphoesterase [Lachnospiraceae bacterium]|nr:metallophosphoesterase [Lachnospiraceae bacterium]